MGVGGASSRAQRLLDMISLVYEIEDREQMLAALFAELRRVLAFSSGVVLPIDPGRFELQGALCFDCPVENTAPYLEHYAAFDPYVRRDPRSLVLNRTVRLSDLADSGELGHSEFSEFMAMVPYRHALAAVCGVDGQPLAAFSVHRAKRQQDFTPGEVAILDCLMPHLGRALALRAWLADPAQREELALLAFDGNGHLLFLNPVARRLLTAEQAAKALAALPPAGPGIVRVGLQRYRVRRLPWRAASLLTHFALPVSGHLSSSHVGYAGCRYGESVDWAEARKIGEPLRIVTLLPFRRRDDIRQRLERHGLSRRELAVTVHAIRSGLANSDIARNLCISEDTVKSHLSEAYRKMGVNSRRELIVKVLGLEGDPLADVEERVRRQRPRTEGGGS